MVQTRYDLAAAKNFKAARPWDAVEQFLNDKASNLKHRPGLREEGTGPAVLELIKALHANEMPISALINRFHVWCKIANVADEDFE